jgi:hypothetical protein
MAGSALAYPELTPRPSIRGCGTTGILPLRAAVKRKKREQSGSWIAKPALGAWEDQSFPGPCLYVRSFQGTGCNANQLSRVLK